MGENTAIYWLNNFNKTVSVKGHCSILSF